MPYTNIDNGILEKIVQRCGQNITHVNFLENTEEIDPFVVRYINEHCPNIHTIDLSSIEVSPLSLPSLQRMMKKVRNFSIGRSTSYCGSELCKLLSVGGALKSLKMQSTSTSGQFCRYLSTSCIEELVFIDLETDFSTLEKVGS